MVALRSVCLALIPTGDLGRDELIVLQEFLAAARLNDAYRPVTTRMGGDLRSVLRSALAPIVDATPEADIEVELLVALTVGLSAEHVQPHGAPPVVEPVEVVERHLRRLVAHVDERGSSPARFHTT